MKYATVVIDPPWRYASKATKADAGKHYTTMSLEEIAALPIGHLAESDAHLWIWITNAFLAEGRSGPLLAAWGFNALTIVTWCKRPPGVGHYLRNNTEHCILATRGKPRTPENKPLSTWFVWPRGEHSAKPDAFYDLVETVSPGPYLDVFARRQRLGWHTWGNEAFDMTEEALE